jgi:hypothetical protein
MSRRSPKTRAGEIRDDCLFHAACPDFALARLRRARAHTCYLLTLAMQVVVIYIKDLVANGGGMK